MKLYTLPLVCLILLIFGSLNGLDHRQLTQSSGQFAPEQQKRETNNKVRYTDLTARRQVGLIYKRLNAGQAFDKLARQFSQDYGSYAVGGNLGWQKPDQFVPAFNEMVRGMRVNQFSKPFKTDFGYHIVQLLDRKDREVLCRHLLLRVEN